MKHYKTLIRVCALGFSVGVGITATSAYYTRGHKTEEGTEVYQISNQLRQLQTEFFEIATLDRNEQVSPRYDDLFKEETTLRERRDELLKNPGAIDYIEAKGSSTPIGLAGLLLGTACSLGGIVIIFGNSIENNRKYEKRIEPDEEIK